MFLVRLLPANQRELLFNGIVAVIKLGTAKKSELSLGKALVLDEIGDKMVNVQIHHRRLFHRFRFLLLRLELFTQQLDQVPCERGKVVFVGQAVAVVCDLGSSGFRFHLQRVDLGLLGVEQKVILDPGRGGHSSRDRRDRLGQRLGQRRSRRELDFRVGSVAGDTDQRGQNSPQVSAVDTRRWSSMVVAKTSGCKCEV